MLPFIFIISIASANVEDGSFKAFEWQNVRISNLSELSAAAERAGDISTALNLRSSSARAGNPPKVFGLIFEILPDESTRARVYELFGRPHPYLGPAAEFDATPIEGRRLAAKLSRAGLFDQFAGMIGQVCRDAPTHEEPAQMLARLGEISTSAGDVNDQVEQIADAFTCADDLSFSPKIRPAYSQIRLKLIAKIVEDLNQTNYLVEATFRMVGRDAEVYFKKESNRVAHKKFGRTSIRNQNLSTKDMLWTDVAKELVVHHEECARSIDELEQLGALPSGLAKYQNIRDNIQIKFLERLREETNQVAKKVLEGLIGNSNPSFSPYAIEAIRFKAWDRDIEAALSQLRHSP